MQILYTFQLSRNSACPSCALITMVSNLTVGLSLHLLCPDLIIVIIIIIYEYLVCLLQSEHRCIQWRRQNFAPGGHGRVAYGFRSSW